jgi:hypothetical protein
MSKFISVSWTEGITEEESGIMIATIEQTLRWFYLRLPAALDSPPLQVRVFGNWLLPALMPDNPYWGTQWYIESSYDADLGRVIAPLFLELVRQEPWQRLDPHFDVALIDQDLTDFPSPLARLRKEHYSLGTSFPGATAVLSVHRIRQLSDDREQRLALARLVRHHLGHVLGVPAFTRQGNAARMGLELHCVDRCVMRHPATVHDLLMMTIEEAEMGWPFCPLCTRELNDIIVRHTYAWS